MTHLFRQCLHCGLDSKAGFFPRRIRAKARAPSTSQRSEQGTQPRQKTARPPARRKREAARRAGHSVPAGLATWARLAVFRSTPPDRISVFLGPGALQSNHHQALFRTLLSLSGWFLSSTLKPGEFNSLTFHSSWSWAGAWVPGFRETSQSLYSSLGWR